MARHHQACLPAYAASQLCHPLAKGRRGHPEHLAPARAGDLNTTEIYTHVARTHLWEAYQRYHLRA
jgi:hypothetical protein